METLSPQKVREMLSPEKKPQDSAQRTGNTTSTVPVATLAARSSDAKGRLIEAELRQKFGEEVRWHKKQADHLTVELETARNKRKELEADFAATKAGLEHQLKEALAENEDLLAAGGGQRGPKAELEASRKEAAGLRKELGILQAKLADGCEVRRIHAGELRDARDRLGAARAEVQALQEALKRGEAQAAQAAEALAQAVARAEQAEGEAGSKAELAAKVAEMEAQAEKATSEAAQASSRAEHAESDAAAAKAELKATVEALEARVSQVEEEASKARAHVTEVQAWAASEERKRTAVVQGAEAAQQQVVELKAQQEAAKKQEAAAVLRAEQAEREARTAQAVYDMAKARAEHSEMAGKVTKAKAEATNMAQRLAAAHLALAEVVHVIHLSSDDVSSGAQNDQGANTKHDKGDQSGRSLSRGSSSLARMQLERVRKIIEQADEQRRASELVQA
ncbi:hypothetical protein DUNSADRAFT_17663 [Dunaliella salina]|uniref:Uncharacterized protein n=1 Tax=Dunaliella salina TaxID=3046 RepID=A0ABQ7G1C2_DUNSA|nr:hypothetical protein DUNSADRAFT_17663 [Dunaliella salina]|eukprot:KAF5828404.1 hypothetical protein DUNSADRAFT_17663 [Dunaliella salina]